MATHISYTGKLEEGVTQQELFDYLDWYAVTNRYNIKLYSQNNQAGRSLRIGPHRNTFGTDLMFIFDKNGNRLELDFGSSRSNMIRVCAYEDRVTDERTFKQAITLLRRLDREFFGKKLEIYIHQYGRLNDDLYRTIMSTEIWP